jgi:protein AATF/BFR2
LEELSELRALLLQHSPAFPKDKIILPHHPDQGLKRKQPHLPHVHDLNSAWHAAQQLDHAFAPYQDATLDKWWQKVAGVQQQQTNKFKTMNQTLTAQITAALRDKDRLRKRTKLLRNNDVPLGVQPREDNHVDHIFDDNDFYSQILRELIDTKAATVDTSKPMVRDVDGVGVMDHVALALTSQQLMLRSLQRKNKKKVDTRASKGRKIRYQVMDKIRNFMAPIPGPINVVSHGLAIDDVNVWHDESRRELFAGLFGGTFKDESTQVIETNGLRLFE